MSIENSAHVSEDPTEVLAIASALADRIGRNQDAYARIQAELGGWVHEPLPANEERIASLGRTVYMLCQLDAPNMVGSLLEYSDAVHNETNQRFVEELSARLGYPLQTDGLMVFQHSLLTQIQKDLDITDEATGRQYQLQFEVAKRLAEEKGVSVADVYTSETLYHEVLRRVASPVEFLAVLPELLNEITSDLLANGALEALNPTLAPDQKDELGPKGVEELALELQLETEVQAQTDRVANLLKEATRQMAFLEFVRIYGHESVEALPGKLKDAVLPKMPWTRPLVELLGTEISSTR